MCIDPWYILVGDMGVLFCFGGGGGGRGEGETELN